MKHLLNDLSEDEKNRIREQHTGGKKIVIENFDKLVNTKLGDPKPYLTEESNKEGDKCNGEVFVIPGQNYVVGETKVKEYMKSRNETYIGVLKCDGGKLKQFGCNLSGDKLSCSQAFD